MTRAVRHRPLGGLMLLLAWAGACSGANKSLPGSANSGDAAPSTLDADVAGDVGASAADGTVDATTLGDGARNGLDGAPVDGAPAETAAPDPCAGLVFCDDFEGSAAGAAPNPILWSIETLDCMGQG